MNQEDLKDLQQRELDSVCVNESELSHPTWYNIKYLIVGILFGIIFVKAEIISWFRIQEMFRLESFHMYGVIGSAIATAMLSLFIIKKLKLKSIYGEPIKIANKEFNKGNIYGGLFFWIGLGNDGSLSRSFVCTDWNRCHRYYRDFTFRNFWDLDLRKIQG